MKLNLLMGGQDVRNGYANIVREVAPLSDTMCPPASCEELLANDVLDYFPAPTRGAVLHHWLSRIKHGGLMTVGGVDFREVARAYMSMKIDAAVAARLVYGEQDLPWRHRKSSSTLAEMVGWFRANGLVVRYKILDGYNYIVTGERP